jgi:hypothetical protein
LLYTFVTPAGRILASIDLGHFDRFRLRTTQPADESIGHDDHLGDVAFANVGGDRIGVRFKVFLADRAPTELADPLGRLAADATLHNAPP